MTIKQQGGVFGRHPSFSTLEVDGQSTLGPVSAENAGTALTAKRTGSEGEIAAWYKDSTKVAGLNVLSGDAWLNVPDRAGLRFSGTSLIPLKNGAVADAQISLGSPIYRLKDIYMAGNVIIGINSGIDFSATSGTGTSELFDDYEEGTFTPELKNATTTVYAVQLGRYTKVGNMVYCHVRLQITTLGDGDPNEIVGFPFTADTTGGNGHHASFGYYSSAVNVIALYSNLAGTTMEVMASAAAAASPSNPANVFGDGRRLDFSIAYRAS